MNLCSHQGALIFWQYGPETERTPSRYVRCYECQTCGQRLHDDTIDASLTTCHHPKHRALPSERRKRTNVIKTISLIDIFDDEAIAMLRSEAARGRPVAVMLPVASNNPRQDADLLLDAVHAGAPSYKPRALGKICKSISGLGRLVYDPEYTFAMRRAEGVVAVEPIGPISPSFVMRPADPTGYALPKVGEVITASDFTPPCTTAGCPGDCGKVH